MYFLSSHVYVKPCISEQDRIFRRERERGGKRDRDKEREREGGEERETEREREIYRQRDECV